MPTPLAPAEFGAMFESFKSSAFRLETLDQYKVPEEAAEFQRFLDGEPLSQNQNRDWCDFVSEAIKNGKRMTRVRIIPVPLTSYLRFEFEWGYAYSAAAGEQILVLERTAADGLGISDVRDFWLFDDETIVRMLYGDDGRFNGGARENDAATKARLINLRDTLLREAVPFREYLKRVRSA